MKRVGWVVCSIRLKKLFAASILLWWVCKTRVVKTPCQQHHITCEAFSESVLPIGRYLKFEFSLFSVFPCLDIFLKTTIIGDFCKTKLLFTVYPYLWPLCWVDLINQKLRRQCLSFTWNKKWIDEEGDFSSDAIRAFLEGVLTINTPVGLSQPLYWLVSDCVIIILQDFACETERENWETRGIKSVIG